jgi:hypothetical protein
VESDYLSSFLRQRILSSLPDREIDLVRITGESNLEIDGADDQWLLTDLNNPLAEWQRDEALAHWKGLSFPNCYWVFSDDLFIFIVRTVMRDVLPDVFWETY